jgi:hypothetical protein
MDMSHADEANVEVEVEVDPIIPPFRVFGVDDPVSAHDATGTEKTTASGSMATPAPVKAHDTTADRPPAGPSGEPDTSGGAGRSWMGGLMNDLRRNLRRNDDVLQNFKIYTAERECMEALTSDWMENKQRMISQLRGMTSEMGRIQFQEAAQREYGEAAIGGRSLYGWFSIHHGDDE